MRSATGMKVQPARQRLPCTRMVSVPAPSTQPPQALRKAARSVISGSFAAPCSTVCPCAVAAASSSVSVAPTLGKLRQISAPRSPAGAYSVSCPGAAGSCRTPICASPCKCRSMGLAPMRHPPGSTVLTRPSRASRGAQNRMDARIRPAASGARSVRIGCPCTASSAPCQPAVQPTPRSRARQSSTSVRRGTFCSRTGPLHSSEAASSGSTLFLAAGTSTLPCKGRPPVMIQSPAMPRPPFCKRYPMVCKTRVFGQQNARKRLSRPLRDLSGHLSAFFRYFRAAPTPLRQEMQPFISFRPGRRKARCPSRPEASSGWCRRRRKRVD